MYRTSSLASAIALALITTNLIGCNGSSDGDPTDYISPSGNGISSAAISYQDNEVYLNGVNVAWLDYANDFGNGMNESALNTLLDQVKEAGGNTIRWWIHVNGSQSPVWNEQHTAIAPATEQTQIIDDIERALDLAQAKGIYIMPCLWSFDMLAQSQLNMSSAIVQANYSLLNNEDVRQSYINNFISPLLDRVAGHPALIAIDLFNEPENMTESWFIEREGLEPSLIPNLNDIHTTTAVFSNAIHEKAHQLNKQVLVTTGPKSLGMFNTDGFGGTNYYSDENMIVLGGSEAPLDFYAPHYYDDLGKNGAWSPFYHKASYWELNKPIVIGEFFADKNAYKPAEFNYFNDPVAEEQLCIRLNDNNYAGGISWQWNNEYNESVLNCVRALSKASEPSDSSARFDFETGDIPEGFIAVSETSGDIQLSVTSTNGHSSSNALSLAINDQPGEKKSYLHLPSSSLDTSELTSINIWVYITAEAASSGYSGGKLYAKTGDSWQWSESEWINVAPEEWTLFSWSPAQALIEIQEVGLQLYAGDQTDAANNVKVYIDDISMISKP
ncbi:cellulase family glycosylhydrolase [uncultured Vibrio sp.]|uniref:cellulase family glycosylhydrolase n=1 Tax=uncultured Vibrio sp. TaxID=114054 RepID=UPI002AA85064|nr:cellulase family glycosylhydrolase [uncultured Vibrio sp.]